MLSKPSFFTCFKTAAKAITKEIRFLNIAFWVKGMSPESLTKAAIRAKKKAERIMRKERYED